MGKEKGGFLTPKAIANRIKAKGLQKLRWYCQMCQKQCRDENGFKCHLSSESHQRQLLLFAENPDEYIDTFSKEFLDTFIELLRRRFGTKRVHANIVYQEYISDREHTHMNSTQWETLTDFVKWLGREGHCVVDETEKGWFITYIDRSPEVLKKQKEADKKEKMAMDDEERTAKFIQGQIERAAASAKQQQQTEFTVLQRDKAEEKVAFNFSAAKKEEPAPHRVSSNPFTDFPTSKPTVTSSKTSTASSRTGRLIGHKHKSALDEIMELEEKKKEKINRKEYWLHPGIVVKIVTKSIGEKYYKKKAYVKEVVDHYGGIIRLLDSGDTLKVDQAHLETVIPAEGKPVLVLNGAYRGHEAVLLSLNKETFSCSVRINEGPLKGRTLDQVAYEDLSKLHVAS